MTGAPLIFDDISPGAFVLVSGFAALVVAKDRGGVRYGDSGRYRTGDYIWIRSTTSVPVHWCKPSQVEPMSLLGPVATDGEFLDAVAVLTDLLALQAILISEWAGTLSAMNMPGTVVNPLRETSDRIRLASETAAQAARAFKEQYGGARDIASRGMRITGQDTG